MKTLLLRQPIADIIIADTTSLDIAQQMGLKGRVSSEFFTEIDITCLLHAWASGEPGAQDALVPLVYKELYRTAQRYMAREGPVTRFRLPLSLVKRIFGYANWKAWIGRIAATSTRSARA